MKTRKIFYNLHSDLGREEEYTEKFNEYLDRIKTGGKNVISVEKKNIDGSIHMEVTIEDKIYQK